MSFIDWNAAALPAQIQGQQNQNALQELNLAQQRQAWNALQGYNVNDPSSVNNALTGLVRANQAQQGQAVSNLTQSRNVNESTLPVIQNALSQAQQPQQQSQQDQADPGKEQRLLTEANQALTDIMSTSDPTQRQQKAAAWKAHFAGEGVSEDAIDSVLGDTTDDPGLQGHQANIQRRLQELAATTSPGFSGAANALNGPLANPVVMGALNNAGIDVSPGLNLAANVTSPARNYSTEAAYSPAIAGATTAAQNVAGANTAGAVRTTAAANAGGTAQGSAPYNPTTIHMTDGSTIQATPVTDGKGNVTGWQQVKQAPGSNTTAPPPSSPSGPGFGATPSIASNAAQAGGAASNVQQANQFEVYSNGYQGRITNLRNLRLAASQIPTGPHAAFWGMLGQLGAEYGIKSPVGPNATAAANYEEVRKVAQQVMAQQADVMGLPNTNQSVNITSGATPHEENSPLGIQRLTGILAGNEDYINAERQAWNAWKGANHDQSTFQDFVGGPRGWNKVFDPRVFQAQYMDPQEKALVRNAVGAQRFDLEEAAARRLGYLGGQ